MSKSLGVWPRTRSRTQPPAKYAMCPAARRRSTSARAVFSIGVICAPERPVFTPLGSPLALRLSSRARSTRSARVAEGINHEADDRDADAGIGDVEGRPRVGEAHVQVKKEEIDDVAVEEAVGEIAEHAGHEQTERAASPGVARFGPQKEYGDNDERDTGERDEKAVVIAE